MNNIVTASYGRCVIDLDNQNRIISADEEFSSLLGQSDTSTLINRTLNDFFSSRGKSFHNTLFKENFPYHGQFSFLRVKDERMNSFYFGICYRDKQTSHLLFDFVVGNNDLIANIPGGIAVATLEENNLVIEYSNEEYHNLLGIGKNSKYLFDDKLMNIEDTKKFILDIQKLNLDNTVYQATIRSNDNRTFLVNAKLFKYVNNVPMFYFVFFDVSLRMELQQHMVNMNNRYRLVHESSNEKIFDYLVEEDCLYLSSPQFEERFQAMKIEGYVNNFKTNTTINEKDRGRFFETFSLSLKQAKRGFIEFRTDLFSKGKMMWHQASYISIVNDENHVTRIMGIISNINEDKDKVSSLENQSIYNSLTTILTEEMCKTKINESLDSNIDDISHALLAVRIDNFGLIKRNYGAGVAEHIIANTLIKVKNLIRSSDYLGRVDESNFIIFMKRLDKSTAEQRARAICDTISQYYGDGTSEVMISSCIGLSYFGIDGFNFETLYEKAKQAMIKAQKNGSNALLSYGDIDTKEIEHFIKQKFISNRVKNINDNYDIELVDRAYELIYSSKGFDEQIKILLEIVMQKYQFDKFVIFQYNYKTNLVEDSYLYRLGKTFKSSSFNSDEALKATKFLLTVYNNRGVYAVEDVEKLAIVNKISFINRLNAKSLISFINHNHVEHLHHLVFVNSNNSSTYDEYDINTLNRLAKFIALLLDIRNERTVNENRIKELLAKDSLTNAYNFDAFRKIYATKVTKIKKGSYYALVSVDIRSFSYINRHFGDSAGDKVLKYLAELLATIHQDIEYARIFSDNFVLLFPCENTEDVESKLIRLDRIFTKHVREIYPNSELCLAIGLFVVKDAKIDVNLAVENADFARCSIKKDYVQRINTYTVRDRVIRENEKNVEVNFRTALKNNEYKLYIQPKFDLKTRKITGAEILTRWINRYGTLQSPIRFIPVLEKIGYIVSLDFYIYEETLKLMKNWQEEGYIIPISINFSRRHINNDRFVHTLSDLANRYGIAKNLIEVEITENAFVDDNAKLLSCLKNLKDAGFLISMDDFGTGYSSLSLLLKAPIDTIKIDKSFIVDVESSAEQRKYLLQITKLIQFANKGIIFEGVETNGQAEFLSDNGFSDGQGYLVSEPLTPSAFEERFLKKK